MKKQKANAVYAVLTFVAAVMFIAYIQNEYLPAEEPLPKTKLQLEVEALSSENYRKDGLIRQIAFDSQGKQIMIDNLASRNDKLSQGFERTKLDYSKLPDVKMYIANLIIREWERNGGTDDLVPLSICKYESNFDPLRRNTNGENSWGLFQVNVGDPAHAKRMQYRDYARLYEPLFNIKYQFPELVAYEKEGIRRGLRGSELAKYVARYGQRPRWTTALAMQVDRYYGEFENAKLN